MGDSLSLNDYYKAFEKYNNIVNNTNGQSNGYLVELQQYDALYHLVKELKKSQDRIGTSNPEDDYKLYKLKTENHIYLKYKISQGYKYKLINEKLYKKICEENDNNKIIFIVSSDSITLYLGEKKEQLKFKNNKDDIIDKAALYNSTQNNITTDQSITPTEKIEDKIYKDIIAYQQNELEISQKINQQIMQSYEIILVDKTWFSNWKTYSYYDEIKQKYILKNIVDEQTIKYYINQRQLVTKFNYDNCVKNIENYVMRNPNQLNLDANKNKTFCLLNKNFFKTLTNKENGECISCLLGKQNIQINCDNKQLLIPVINNSITLNNLNNNSNQNLINQNNNINGNIYHSPVLNHLIRTLYFKNEFIEKETFPTSIVQAFLIKKEIFSKLKKIYNLEGIIIYFNRFQLLNGLSYNNFEQNYTRLSTFLNQNEKKYINDIQKYEMSAMNDINEINGDCFFDYNNGQIYLKYVDNFEIIDQNFAIFLKQKFNNINPIGINFVNKDRKILLITKFNENNIYEIASLNQNDYSVEYIIEIANNYTIKDINYIIKDILNEITNNKYYLNMSSQISSNKSYYTIKMHPLKLNQIYNLNNKDNNTINPSTDIQLNNRGRINQNIENNNSIIGKPGRNANKYQLESINLNNPNQTYIGGMKNNMYAKFQNNNENMEIEEEGKINNIYRSVNQINSLNAISNLKSNQSPNMQNLDNNLIYSLGLLKERKQLLDSISQPNGNRNEPKKEYYLINKYYLKEINNKFHLNIIKEIFNANQWKNDNEIINILKRDLPENIKININNLTKENITNSLNKNEIREIKHYYANNDRSTNLLYYNHCDIISEKLLLLLNKYDENIINFIQKVECVFDKNTIIIFIKKQIINIAYYDKEIYIKQVIISNSQFNLQAIFDLFGQKGYDDVMRTFYSNNLINYNIKQPNNQFYTVQANVYSINDDGKLIYTPSNRLKTLILFAVSQQYFNDNQIEKVYLMNQKWLDEYTYPDIKKKVIKILNKGNLVLNFSNDFNSISNIIQSFPQEELEKYDKKIQNNRNISHLPSLSEPFAIQNKYIDSYKKFVLINDKISELFKRSFGITFPNDNIYYIHKSQNLDFLCFQNYKPKNQLNQINDQNYILIGNINREESKFLVSHILDYKDKNILEKEMQYFIQRNFQNYIQDKIGLTNPNEIFSPIFDNNQIIGN